MDAEKYTGHSYKIGDSITEYLDNSKTPRLIRPCANEGGQPTRNTYLFQCNKWQAILPSVLTFGLMGIICAVRW